MQELRSGYWEISTAIAKGEVVFFVGAGLSATSGLPTCGELARDLKVELRPRKDETDPLLVAQF